MSRPAPAGILPRLTTPRLALPGLFRALLLLAALAVSAALAAVPALALDVPSNRGQWVVDTAQLLPPKARNQLAAELRRYAETTGNQIVVLTIPSLQGEEIAAFANRVAREWGVGGRDRNNGVLILLARAEGRVRFEVGRGIEDRLPDLLSKRIQQELMVPEFRARRFGPGLFKGVEAIEQALTPAPGPGEDGNATLPGEPQPKGVQGSDGPPLGFTLILALLALFMFLGLLWKRHGQRYDPALRRQAGLPPVDGFFFWGFLFGLLGNIFGGRGGRGGGFGGGMDGGGFSGGGDGGFSGGGGDFGGGGADSDFGGSDGGGDSGGGSGD